MSRPTREPKHRVDGNGEVQNLTLPREYDNTNRAPLRVHDGTTARTRRNRRTKLQDAISTLSGLDFFYWSNGAQNSCRGGPGQPRGIGHDKDRLTRSCVFERCNRQSWQVRRRDTNCGHIASFVYGNKLYVVINLTSLDR